jgi:hypothetical protein
MIALRSQSMVGCSHRRQQRFSQTRTLAPVAVEIRELSLFHPFVAKRLVRSQANSSDTPVPLGRFGVPRWMFDPRGENGRCVQLVHSHLAHLPDKE